MDRAAAWELVCEYVASESLRRHMLAVEAAMRAYAELEGEDPERWGVVGLLHDFDYERWPNSPDHPEQGAKILAERGGDAGVMYAIRSRAGYVADGRGRSRLDKTLYACDELAGFITACAMVRPGRLEGLEAASVLKKLKNRSFAAAINREDIDRGAADLGVGLREHIDRVIAAMRAVADRLGLSPLESA